MSFKNKILSPALLIAWFIFCPPANARMLPGIYFWDGNIQTRNKESIMSTGHKLLKNIGAKSIRITMHAGSDIDYNNGKCMENFNLTRLAKRNDYHSILSDPQFEVIMITAYDGISKNCQKNYFLDPNFYKDGITWAIQKRYMKFASYLNVNFPDKTFFISFWEGDNTVYCGSAWDTLPEKCADFQKNIAGLKKWISARESGIKLSGAENVYNVVEFNAVNMLKNRGLPSILYDVIPFVDSNYFSYSAYESTGLMDRGLDEGEKLIKDIKIIKGRLKQYGKAFDNLIIGELGFGEGGRKNNKNNLKGAVKILEQLGIKYIFIWNLLDVGGTFGLYYSDGTLTPAGKYYRKLADSHGK